tara:strand:- start:2902 stop:3600 length:699 start_codon:yes stop_codon:yes gene_type:complete
MNKKLSRNTLFLLASCFCFSLFFNILHTKANEKTLRGATNFLEASITGTGIDATQTVESQSGTIINLALSLITAVFFILMVYAGYTWMIARENEEQAKKARTMMTTAIIGLIIVISSYTITNVVLQGATGTTKPTNEKIEEAKDLVYGCCINMINDSWGTNEYSCSIKTKEECVLEQKSCSVGDPVCGNGTSGFNSTFSSYSLCVDICNKANEFGGDDLQTTLFSEPNWQLN